MKLYCKYCHTEITNSPLVLSKVEALDFGDGRELLKEGNYILASEAEYNFEIPIKYLLHSKTTSLINHHDKIKFQGCCGPSEFNKLNQVCPQCKFEIGVLIADCWTSRFVGIHGAKVSSKTI